MRAVETWRTKGFPEHPSAWLLATAKNRALDLLRRERTAHSTAPDLQRATEALLQGDARPLEELVDEAFAPPALRDEQLRMMFSCCHPKLPEEAQLALVLNILCGFGAAEIASAFLAGRAAVEKRIARGKKALAAAKSLFELDDADFKARLSTVHRALYLLFNEGYQGASAVAAVRAELCDEALRLAALLREHPPAATPATFALGALFCLHGARMPARLDPRGDLAALGDQDRSKWDAALVAEGLALFERSATGEELSAYHLEAAIAAVHAAAPSAAETDWPAIVSLYDRLLELSPSPVVALGRAVAIGQRDPQRGLDELRAIGDERLARYPFLAAALGEFEARRVDRPAARAHFTAALALARNDAERRFLEKRIAALAG